MEIKTEIDRLAVKIGASGYVLPTYGHSEDSARPHLEVDSRGYHYVVVERGEELRRNTTTELDELLRQVFVSVTFQLAGSYEVAHRIKGQDSRRLLWQRQLELLRLLSPVWAATREREIGNLLQEHPYHDPHVA